MAPGIDGLPAAERDVDVSGPVAEFLSSLSPRMLTGSGSACAPSSGCRSPGASAASTPPPATTSCAAWRRSRFRLHHELLLMAKIFSTLGYAVTPEVEERIGIETSCRARRRHAFPSRPARSATPSPSGEARNATSSSSAPAPAARPRRRQLAEAGLDVIVLEAGSHYNRDNYPSGHLDAIATLYRDAGLTIAEGNPPIPVPVAKVVGGTTVINSGTCFRAPTPVLERLARRARRRAGRGDLDPYFAEAEEFLRVTPLDPERMGRNGQLAMEGAAAIGASGGPISRNAGNCVQCSSCPFGCEIDAKRGMHVSYLPPRGGRRGPDAGRRRGAAGPGRGRPRRRGALRSASANGGARRLHGPSPAGDDRRRRGAGHAGAAAALRARRRARSGATSTSTRPAGSAPATRRRCVAGRA